MEERRSSILDACMCRHAVEYRERERERERDTVSLFHPYAVDHRALSLKKQIGSRYICSSTPDIFSIANFSQYNITLCVPSTSDFKLHFE